MDQIMFLQRTIGNHSIQSLIRSGILKRQITEKEEDNEKLQKKPTEEEVKSASDLPELDLGIENQIQSIKGGGKLLLEGERAFFEPRFGSDLSHVSIHADVRAAETARAVNARAFTMGHDIVFGAGQYIPGT